ncbi:MAG: CmcJ/NvfI family oxidoreductase [Stellaceae bacterium]
MTMMTTARQVTATINYLGAMTERPRFHANDHSRDNLILEGHEVRIEDARGRDTLPSLAREGLALVEHRSAIADFRDEAAVMRLAPAEAIGLIRDVTGAEAVVMLGVPLWRFGERSDDSGRLNNSLPARFVHIDGSDARVRETAAQLRPKDIDRPIRRYAMFNIWRAISPPPQDIPLALCDALSVAPQDTVIADAVFDYYDRPEWSAESTLLRYNPAHRWVYFANMTRDEALVFITKDSDLARPHHVPHSAFDDPSCPADVAPRASIEMRAMGFWFD